MTTKTTTAMTTITTKVIKDNNHITNRNSVIMMFKKVGTWCLSVWNPCGEENYSRQLQISDLFRISSMSKYTEFSYENVVLFVFVPIKQIMKCSLYFLSHTQNTVFIILHVQHIKQ